MMRPSMWSSYLIELTPEEMVTTFVEHGWDCTELSDEHGWMLLERGSPEKAGSEFLKFAQDKGFSFPQGHFYLTANIAHPDDKERTKIMDDLKRWCDLFAALDIKAGVLHPYGGAKSDLSFEEKSKTVISSLEELLQYSKGSPTTICLENLIVDMNSLDQLMFLADAVDKEAIGFCLDTGHLNMNDGDYVEFVRKTGDRLRALHITDSVGDIDHMMPYGAGTIDWPALIKTLREIGYDGLFNLEVPKENHCPMEIRLLKLDYIRDMLKFMLA